MFASRDLWQLVEPEPPAEKDLPHRKEAKAFQKPYLPLERSDPMVELGFSCASQIIHNFHCEQRCGHGLYTMLGVVCTSFKLLTNGLVKRVSWKRSRRSSHKTRDYRSSQHGLYGNAERTISSDHVLSEFVTYFQGLSSIRSVLLNASRAAFEAL